MESAVGTTSSAEEPAGSNRARAAVSEVSAIMLSRARTVAPGPAVPARAGPSHDRIIIDRPVGLSISSTSHWSQRSGRWEATCAPVRHLEGLCAEARPEQEQIREVVRVETAHLMHSVQAVQNRVSVHV